MRALLIALTAVVVSASPAFAQGSACTTPDPGAGFVCHGGQWLPPGHPLIPVTTTAPNCDPLPNPYTEPDRAAACSAWDAEHRPKPVLPTFETGAVYADAYAQTRISVLGVSLSLEGVPVVTGQRVAPADGAVITFRTTDIIAQQWRRVR
jgi:hypothetical protein